MTKALSISVERQNIPVASFQLDKTMVRIGRGSDCDISLHDPLISNLHCVLRFKDDSWLLEDCSRNGIQLEGEEGPRDRFKLQGSKRLRLGKLYRLKIEPADATKKTSERTILTSQQPTQLLSVENSKVIVGTAVLKANLPSGESLVKRVEDRSFTLGTHESNDFVCSSSRVSKFHARIDADGQQFTLTDLSSTNGTFIDEIRIDRATLKGKCRIRLADCEVEFSLERQERPIEAKGQTHFMGMVSQDKEMQKLFSLVEAVADTQAPVLIHGETGSGKELMARAIHQVSSRYHRPFITLNCAALPKDLVESELFGHEKGSFTGATQQRIGAFEAAHDGTLFLDEIGELDLSLQAKLLRALESGEIKRVGSNQSQSVKVRIITASHRKLDEEVKRGRFREDLYFRLHVVPLTIPALRFRLNDLPLLVPDLLQKLGITLRVAEEALQGLQHYDFPGNIRELKNILQRAAVEYEINLSARRENGILQMDHFRFLDDLRALRLPKTKSEEEERELMIKLLEDCHYNQSEASRRMGVANSTFHDRLKRFGIEIPHPPRRK